MAERQALDLVCVVPELAFAVNARHIENDHIHLLSFRGWAAIGARFL
jgi:hypothetical protein